MMSPVFAVLVYLGEIPDLDIIVIGVIIVFAGYTSVYALNDIVGYKDDIKKIRNNRRYSGLVDLDSVFVRHPLAQGYIRLKSAVWWAACWGGVALTGAYYLNPVCVLIFLSAALLEVGYCLLLKITFLRILFSGFVKTAGPIAAIFAVDPSPEPVLPILIFVFHFLWEAGGQNIPNDYTDMEEDKLLKAKTLPIQFDRKITCWLVVTLLIGAFLTTSAIFFYAPIVFNTIAFVILIVGSLLFLIIPALRLTITNNNREAMILFNKASYYPLFLSTLVTVIIVI